MPGKPPSTLLPAIFNHLWELWRNPLRLFPRSASGVLGKKFGCEIPEVAECRLQSRCTELQDLLIDDPRRDVTSKGLLRCLSGSPSLEVFRTWSGLEQALSEPVLLKLAALPQLRSPEILGLKSITENMIDKTEESNPEQFLQIQYLHCETDCKYFTRLQAFSHENFGIGFGVK